MCLGLVRYSVRVLRHPCQFGIIPRCYPSLVIVQLLLPSQNPAQNVLSLSVFKFTSVVSSMQVLYMYVYLSTSLSCSESGLVFCLFSYLLLLVISICHILALMFPSYVFVFLLIQICTPPKVLSAPFGYFQVCTGSSWI